MKITETIQPSVKRQRAELAESLSNAAITNVMTETHMSIFEANRGVWQESSFEDIMAELDQADQEDASA